MRRFDLVDRGVIRLDESASVPEPGPGEVLVRVKACTVCNRSDLVYFHYLGLRDHCDDGCFGHEVAGVVERVGPEVTRAHRGQRVFVRKPQTSGYADFAVAREIAVATLPEPVVFEKGAILQLLPLAVHATRGVRLGDRVAILGQGPVGLMALQVTRLRGASEIVAADLDKWRLARSSILGADHTAHVDGSLEALVALGRGTFDVAIDAVGTPQTAQGAVDLVRQNGLIVLLGTHHVDTHVTFDLIQWERKGLRIHTSAEPTDHARVEALTVAERLVANDRIRLDPLLTHTYPLERLPEAIERLSASCLLSPAADAAPYAAPPAQVLKVAICP